MYLISFFVLERVFILDYVGISCKLDYMIPFCEYFIIPYVFWYLFLFFIHIYTLLYDLEAFKKLMVFLIITFGAATVIFILFPNMQTLRPNEFARDNIFTDAVKFLYVIDTNTNVCPSLHVVGSFAVLFTAWNSKGLNTAVCRIIFLIITLLITMSTVFLKQHSVIDTVVGIVLAFVVMPFVYVLPKFYKKNRKR